MTRQSREEPPTPVLRPVENFPEVDEGVAVELVADYSEGTIRPGVSLDWERLNRGELSARLAVQDPQGQTHYIPFRMQGSQLGVLTSIGERYQGEAELPQAKKAALVAPEDAAAYSAPEGHKVSSPSEKVNELVHWQQFLDTVRALKPERGYDDLWTYMREKLLDRVEILYAQNFGQLRNQLRNERNGAAVVRMVFRSENETLIDIGLRLVTLESSLNAALQEDLVAIYTNESFSEPLRMRAYSRLNPASRSAVLERWAEAS